ncbi:MAG: response regulator [Nitrospinae bacterium]|nr:response regulator [Nitrospinota bacterium]
MEARKVIRLAKGSRVTALAVDDNQLNRDVLSKMLSCIGVLEAESGLAALDIVRKNAPDIVFMDYRMPGMNGDEAIRHIKLEFGKKIKTVIVSASAYDHEREIFHKHYVFSIPKIIRPYFKFNRKLLGKTLQNLTFNDFLAAFYQNFGEAGKSLRFFSFSSGSQVFLVFVRAARPPQTPKRPLNQ